ncbi:ABC transporter substrate-binding protein [Paraburkholderia dinghuensis]|uniref:ABC transporter substrate-binding protein n=1 Tax=Paraburkholderia dinghuensis TaxID=2305225 RepID=A0A3N6MVQ6_9BURK|nr:ABC transporter substrate-binding protein [Paraburkholderia dinghuensis]RQH08018.1 ABC transporter substrate-binding protein [Paraburkholderia dinghuensis]
MKKLALCVALALAAGGAYAKDWSTIRFGTDASYAPFESKAPDGKLVGFDIDLGNEICRRLNAKCVWVEQDFDGMIPGLKSRKFDGALSALTMTPQREQQIAFSARMYNTPTRLVAKKGSTVLPTIESLKGKTVGVEQGSTQETYAKENWASKGVNVVTYQNQDQVYLDLQSGRLDAALQDEIQADLGFLKTPRGAGFAFAGPQIPTGAAAIGMRKDDTDLKSKIDKAIADMVKDGTYRKIASKYFDFDVYGS